MTDLDATETPEASWLGSQSDANDLRRYFATLRHRGWLILVTMVVAVVVAAVYVKSATPVYKAQSNLLVSPIPSGSSIPSNIPGLIYASADPTRDVLTAANLVSSIEIAGDVRTRLGLHDSPQTILGHISAQPLSNTNVVAITASSDTAAGSARLANAFANTAITVRRERFQSAVNQEIASLQAHGGSGAVTTTSGGATIPVSREIAQLQALAAGPIPDMSVSAAAVPPSGRSSPRATLSLAAGLIVGLVVGILGVLALEEFDSRLRREDQLKRIFRLPILARIPRDGSPGRLVRRGTSTPRTPQSFSFAALESFRTLRAMALASREPGQSPPRTLLVTSAAPSEGKTTTALNLASSLAVSGADVILIEGDLRRPAIGEALKLRARYDVSSVVTGEVELEKALVSSERCPGVRFLLAEGVRSEGRFGGDALFLPAATRMLSDAASVADFVVVDSPPLLAVIDALELARVADEVLIVTQLGRTDLRQLQALGALLAEAHIEPIGVALIGGQLPGGRQAYDYERGGRTEPRRDETQAPHAVDVDANGARKSPARYRRSVGERPGDRK